MNDEKKYLRKRMMTTNDEAKIWIICFCIKNNCVVNFAKRKKEKYTSEINKIFRQKCYPLKKNNYYVQNYFML